MQDFLDTKTLFIAYYIYKQLETNPKENIWLTAHQILTADMSEPFATEEETEYWLELDCNYFNELSNIFEVLQKRFSLKYTSFEDESYFDKENVYGKDITPDKPFPEILHLMFLINTDNDKFVQAFDEYIDDYCRSQLTGIDILNFPTQSKIVQNIINTKFKEKGNTELILSCKEIDKIAETKKVRILEYLIQAEIYNQYELFNINIKHKNSRTLKKDCDKFSIIARLKTQNIQEELKNVIFINTNEKTLKYCNQTISLEPKQLKVIIGIKTLSKNLADNNNFINDLKKLAEIDENNTLQSKISSINRDISKIQNQFNIIPAEKFITSNLEKGRAVNYYFAPFYKVQIIS